MFMPFMDEPSGARFSTAAMTYYGRLIRALRAITNNTVNVGDKFQLVVSVIDSRPAGTPSSGPSGVFTAYLDVDYGTGTGAVHLDVTLENDRGEKPVQGTAVVELPRRA